MTIAACRPNSPAAEAGFRSGDQVVEIAGQKITRLAELTQGTQPPLRRRQSRHRGAPRQASGSQAELQLTDKLDPYQHPLLGILPLRTAEKLRRDGPLCLSAEPRRAGRDRRRRPCC